MKKKLVYVDIGTHMGQEFKALFVFFGSFFIDLQNSFSFVYSSEE